MFFKNLLKAQSTELTNERLLNPYVKYLSENTDCQALRLIKFSFCEDAAIDAPSFVSIENAFLCAFNTYSDPNSVDKVV